ncbi:MAG: hypothetical protein ACREN6_08515 [Gemmatimonadaceae bacterium]
MAAGVNLYGYAGGDPANSSDPFGLCPPKDENKADCKDDKQKEGKSSSDSNDPRGGTGQPTQSIPLGYIPAGKRVLADGIQITATPQGAQAFATIDDRGALTLSVSGKVEVRIEGWPSFTLTRGAINLQTGEYGAEGYIVPGIAAGRVTGNIQTGAKDWKIGPFGIFHGHVDPHIAP